MELVSLPDLFALCTLQHTNQQLDMHHRTYRFSSNKYVVVRWLARLFRIGEMSSSNFSPRPDTLTKGFCDFHHFLHANAVEKL
jgi:hypothetical protein